MPCKLWDQAPLPNESHRRIAAEARLREILEQARLSGTLGAEAQRFLQTIEGFLGVYGEIAPENRRIYLRRVAGSVLSDALVRLLSQSPSDNR